MKKYNFFISFMLAVIFLLSSLGNSVNAQEINRGNSSNIQIEDSEYGLLNVKTIEEEEKVTTETYSGDELLSKTIVYKTDGRIEEFDNLGNKQTSYIGDYVKNTDGTKTGSDVFAEPNIYIDEESDYTSFKKSEQSVMPRYSVPSGYTNIRNEYS